MLTLDLFEQPKPNKKSAAFCFGRLNPPTLGHKLLLDTVAGADADEYYIFVSQTHKAPDNPLSYQDKVKFIQAMFPEHSNNVVVDTGLNTIMKVAAWVYNQGVTEAVFVAGSDRIEDFKKLLDRYNGHGEPGVEGYYNFDTINYISSGERDPDSEGVAGYSASRARAAAVADNLQEFAEVTGAGDLAQSLFDAVKAGMAVPEKKPRKPKKDQQSLKEVQVEDTDISPNDLMRSGKVIGTIEGNDVIMLSKNNQTVYILKVGDQASAFVGFEGENLKNIKNFTKTPGVVRALIGYLVHKENKKILISPKEPLTPDGLRWVISLINDPRGLVIKNHAGKDINTTKLKQEWLAAKKTGQPSTTGITISENVEFGVKIRENEARRNADSLLMPVNFYAINSNKKKVQETIRKVKDGYRLVSHSGKNLGTYPSRSGAERRERQVNYFKHVKENTDVNNIKDTVTEFVKFAAEYLKLDQLPSIEPVYSIEGGTQPSFGGYDPNKQSIRFAIANRHPNDILRTLAHELVHYKQDLLDKIKPHSGETGSSEENQANTIAGIIMRLYNKEHPASLSSRPVILESQEDYQDPLEEDIQNKLKNALGVMVKPQGRESGDLVSATVKYHSDLSPAAFQGDRLRPDVRRRLLEIADRFIASIKYPDFDALDIVLTGSMANYNWTKFSDFDLHVITEYDQLTCDQIAEEFYQAKKKLWNDAYDITINDHEVELYVEDQNDPPISSGVYSVLEDRWITKPDHTNPSVDLRAVRAKAKKTLKDVLRALNSLDSSDDVSEIFDRVRAMRQAGLEDGGEFSVENLAYKALRNAGILDRLSELRIRYLSHELSR